MSKFKKSQILMLTLLAILLLIITPIFSSSLRPTYLYFVIVNILIIALGAEAGLLSSSLSTKPSDDKKHPSSAAPKPLMSSEISPDNGGLKNNNDSSLDVAPETTDQIKKAKVIEKSASEKISGTVKMDNVKKCPSMPSLFYIGGGETSEAEAVEEDYYYDEEEEEESEDDEVSEKELFTKAEMFIGNFYKQLKMQREESWKRIHGFYHKAF